MRLKLFHFIIASVFLLASCGGGSDGSGELKTGQFWDSPVKGLHYKTASLEGTTNTNGEFQYREGETVTFSLGKTVLGSAKGSSRISPFDLLLLPPPAAGDLSKEIFEMLFDNGVTAFEHGVNILIFLQSLDADNNPDNGIDIPPAVADFFLLIFEAVLFDQNNEDFAAAFFVLFFQLVSEGLLENRGNDPQPVDYKDAITHFYKELLGEDVVL